MIRILFAGDFDPEYNRTKIVLKGLSSMKSVKVKLYRFKKKEWDRSLFMELESNSDVVFLPSFSHSTANILLKFASKPVVFDPLISKYLTKVFDYQQISKYSIRAFKNFRKDKVPMRNCNHLIADTLAHKKYYSQTFNIPLNKFSVLPVGVDCEAYMPMNKSEDTNKFIVGFYGGFIPLQGVRVIIDAAIELKSHLDIEFRLIGSGFEYEKMQKIVSEHNLTNVTFLGWLESNKLPQSIADFDICLGIFGDTIKAKLVVPNKIYHYAAMAKPIITMNSPAIKEMFTNQKDVILIDVVKGELAKEILNQKKDPNSYKSIGDNARQLVKELYSETQISEQFVEIVKSVL